MQAKQYEVRPTNCAFRAAILILLCSQERILKLQDALEMQKLKNTCTWLTA